MGLIFIVFSCVYVYNLYYLYMTFYVMTVRKVSSSGDKSSRLWKENTLDSIWFLSTPYERVVSKTRNL